MSLYEVRVVETLTRDIHVTAETPGEARDKARQDYRDGVVELDANNSLTNVEFIRVRLLNEGREI